TVASVNIASADIKGYTYKDLLLDANLNNGDAAIQSTMNDPNIRYALKATANVKNTYPSIQMQLQLDTLNLYALHFVDTLLTLHTMVNADMASTNPDSLIGNIFITNTRLINIDKVFNADSVKFVAERKGNLQSIKLNSEVATLDWKGEYKLTETADQVMKSIMGYYNLPYKIKDTNFSAQQWLMDIVKRFRYAGSAHCI
ncbi:MAG: hypothetical protein ABI861_05710, partial [Panacibacter sp.]